MDNETQRTTEVRERDAVTDSGERVHRQTVAEGGVASADRRVVTSRVIWYIAGFIIAVFIGKVSEEVEEDGGVVVFS